MNLCVYVERIPSSDPSGCYGRGFKWSTRPEARGDRMARAHRGPGRGLEPIPEPARPAQPCPCDSRSRIHEPAVNAPNRGLQVSRSVRLIESKIANMYLALVVSAQNNEYSQAYERFPTDDPTAPDILTHVATESFLHLTALPCPVAGPVMRYGRLTRPTAQVTRRPCLKSHTHFGEEELTMTSYPSPRGRPRPIAAQGPGSRVAGRPDRLPIPASA